MQAMSMPMGGGGFPGQQTDMNKIFKTEKENLEVNQHLWELEYIEEKILQKYNDFK